MQIVSRGLGGEGERGGVDIKREKLGKENRKLKESIVDELTLALKNDW